MISRMHEEEGDTEALLASVKVFAGLEPRELAEVSRVAVPRSFERGEIIFREGDGGDTCYVVRFGTVSIRRDHPDGRSRALAELRPGSIFGELSMFGAETRSATAEALEATSLVAILRADLQRVIRSSPDIAFKMLAELADRVRLVNEQLARQSFQTVSGRVASTLLAQVITRQTEGAGDRDVTIKATQSEIAQLAGTSRESASRFLGTLAREGIVTLGRGRVVVHDPDRLRGFIH
jgi:CRP/FNR family transcriptional regulator